MSQTAKLPSNRLVKWQGKSSAILIPEGLDPNQDEQLKKFGPWKLIQSSQAE